MCERIINPESIRQQEIIASDIAASALLDTVDSGSTSAVVETSIPAPAPKNYIKEFYSNPSLEFDVFAASRGVSSPLDETIDTITKEIKKLSKKLESLNSDLSETYSKKYSSQYTPIHERVIIKYVPRGYSKDNLYFELSTGMRVAQDSVNEENYNTSDIVYTIHSKHESTYVLAGYAFDTASVIVKDVDITISQDNLKLKSKILNEYAYSFLTANDSSNVYNSHGSTPFIKPTYLNSALINVNPDTFVNTLYGVSRKFKYHSLNSIYAEIKNNINFELIVKQAPDDVFEELITQRESTPKPLHELCGLDKETYREAVKRNLIAETRSLSKIFEKRSELHKTPAEIFSLLDKFKTYEKDLNFYGITYSVNWPLTGKYGNCNQAKLFGLLAASYLTYEEFNTKYSFGKYADYVIQESINQGYSTINNFLTELKDYITMCNTNKVTPSLFSSYLKQTHDIAARNSRLDVSTEDENKFSTKYADFKPFKCKIGDTDKVEYHVIAPDSTLAIKDEGCQLNHCVTSYIKRVIDGDCLIYFLRTDPKSSLITLEIEDNTIVQARGLHNRFPNEEEALAIKEFAEKRGMTVDY